MNGQHNKKEGILFRHLLFAVKIYFSASAIILSMATDIPSGFFPPA